MKVYITIQEYEAIKSLLDLAATVSSESSVYLYEKEVHDGYNLIEKIERQMQNIHMKKRIKQIKKELNM